MSSRHLFEVDENEFNARMIELSKQQFDPPCVWLHDVLATGRFKEPGVGRVVRRQPLLPLWQAFVSQVWQPSMQDLFDAYKASERPLDFSGLRLAKRGLKLDALDFSDYEVTRHRAEEFLPALRSARERLGSSRKQEGSHWWPTTVEGVIEAVKAERKNQMRAEEEEKRRLAGLRRVPIDEKAMKRVSKWREGVLPPESAQQPWLWAKTYEAEYDTLSEDAAVADAAAASAAASKEEKEREEREERAQMKRKRETEEKQDEHDVEMATTTAALSHLASKLTVGERRSHSKASASSTPMAAADTNVKVRRSSPMAKRMREGEGVAP